MVELSGQTNQLRPQDEQHLVLIGGGHAHLQVLKALNKASRPANLKVTLIDMQCSASYSGMVPGAISGFFQPTDTLLHLEPLAKWAGTQFLHKQVVDLDFENRVVLVQDIADNDNCDQESSDISPVSKRRTTSIESDTEDDELNYNNRSHCEAIPFDVVSLDIGSTSRGLRKVPGAEQYTIPTRPIADLVRHLEDITAELQQTRMMLSTATSSVFSGTSFSLPIKLVVIGGGMTGIELSMSVRGRWAPILVGNQYGRHGSMRHVLQITVLDSGSELLPSEESQDYRLAMEKVLKDYEINVRHGCVVTKVNKETLCLATGEEIPFTVCVWATGAGAHNLSHRLASRGLAVSEHGWIQVNQNLQSLSHPRVFAAGDCCAIEVESSGDDGLKKSSPPKAGVFAVRSGPILISNLTKMLEYYQKNDSANGTNVHKVPFPILTKFVPQQDFLKLIGCGDGTAIGFRYGIPIRGKWVFDLKKAIDTGFLKLFQVQYLPHNGSVGQNGKQQGKHYDTSQYDASTQPRPPPLSPQEAVELLRRSDDDVDYQVAWNVLRDMNDDIEYRNRVLIEYRR